MKLYFSSPSFTVRNLALVRGRVGRGREGEAGGKERGEGEREKGRVGVKRWGGA